MYDLFFRRPRLTVLFIGLLLVAGLSALNSLPRQEDPELSERFGSVTTFLPAADAARVEALVTERIESVLQDVEEIKHVSSRSQTGFSVVSIDLEDSITDTDPVWSLIRNKITDAELPPDASVPEVEIFTTAAFTYLVGFTWDLDSEPQLDLLYRLARELEQKLISLPGTNKVEIYGDPQEEVLVTVSAETLASRNITTTEIANAIRRADAKVSAGRLQGETTDLVLQVTGELDSINRVRNVPVRRTEDDQILRVGDLARVTKQLREPLETIALIDGRPGIIIAAKMEANRRVDRWVEDAERLLNGYRETLPQGVSARTIFDQSTHTEERLDSLVENLLVGAGLVVVVLFIMMGWRSALLVSSALPLTLLMVMFGLNILGVPLHQISLTGLIIALGLLIDNAIVSIDDYGKARRRGLDRGAAIRETVGHLFIPLFASTLTTAFTFLPLVIMPGNAGEFVGTLGVSVILSIFFSFFLSLTILPAVAAFIDRGNPEDKKRSFISDGISVPFLSRLYGGIIGFTLRKPLFGILIAITIPVSGFVVAGQLVEQFFPPVDRNQFQIQVKLADHASIHETTEAVQRVRGVLAKHEEVESSIFFIGETPARTFYNVSIDDDGAPNFAGGFVNTASPEATFKVLQTLQYELEEALPEAFVLALPYEQGPPVPAPLEVRLYGPDVDMLRVLGDDVRRILSETKNVTFTRATIAGGRPKLDLVADEDLAAMVGFNLVDLAESLNASLDGTVGGTMLEGTEELPVRVRIDEADRVTIQSIQSNTVRAPGRDMQEAEETVGGIPLRAMGDFELVPQTHLITRRDGERLNTVQAFVQPFTLPGIALDDFRKRMEESNFTLPAGYRLQYGGEAEGSGEARANLLSVFAPLIILMIGTLVLAFNSFRDAGVIVIVAILSIGGALLTLWMFGHPLGFMAVVGCMGLIGLAINDSIVVLSALRADRKACEGDLAAAHFVVMDGTRHIISTTLTTIGGFIPLIIWGGLFWPPLAMAIAGGMIGATMLALFFVPPMFVIMVRMKLRRERKAEARRARLAQRTA
jgi:multidrug efflux pump subunit AcrB